MSTPFVSPDPEGTHSRQIGRRVKKRRLSPRTSPHPFTVFLCFPFYKIGAPLGTTHAFNRNATLGTTQAFNRNAMLGTTHALSRGYCLPCSFLFSSFLLIDAPSAGNATLETHQAFMLCSLF